MATPDQERPDLVPLIDLEPDDADAVCDAMANVGLEAIRHRLDPGGDRDIGRMVVRIYVPRSQMRDARDVVRGVLPEYRAPGSQEPARPASLAPSEEEQWSRIVADLRGDGLDTPAPAAPPPAAVPELEHEPGFEPPPPPPLPRLSRTTIMAWAALAAGAVLSVVGLGAGGEKLLALLGIGLFIGGFIALVARAGEGRDPDDSDDGAVV